MPTYRRVIVKLSGEALSGPASFGIHQATIDRFAADIAARTWADHRSGGGGNAVLRKVESRGARRRANPNAECSTVFNALSPYTVA